MLLLPTYNWNVDPVFFRLPRDTISYIIGGIGVLFILYGLVKKEKEQLWTGAIFAAVAMAVRMFAGDGLEIRYYSLLFVVVFLGGHALLNWQVKRGGGGPEVASDFIIYGVAGVLIGARLGHVLFYDLEKALDDPMWVFKIWTGGLASHGAVIGLITAMYLFTKRRGVSFLEGSDRFAFSAALGATVVRIGNLLNSEIVGRQTDQSWGFRFVRNEGLNGPLRYPSQVYEIALGIATFIGLLIADKAMGKEKRPRGALISWFFALYFTGRLFTEKYKEFEGISSDSALTMGQYLSIPGALLGFYGLYWSYKHRLPAGWPRPEDEEEEDEETEEEDEDEEDLDEEEDEDESEEDESDESDEDEEEDEDDEEEEEPADEGPSKKKSAPVKGKSGSADPDVEDEFKDGKLKRSREPHED